MELLTKASPSSEPNQRELRNRKVAYDAACEGMVLLKNDGMLPLKTRRVALYGPGASMTVKGGTGSGEVNERHSVTILEGLQDRGFEITTMDWIRSFEEQYAREEQAYKEDKKKRVSLKNISNIMNVLFENFSIPSGPVITSADVARSGTDTCIYVLSRQAGEGGDRRAEKGDYFLTDGEKASIRVCAEQYPHFLLVINSGSGMDMSFVDEIPGINAIVFLCQPGTEGGNAFADIIIGTVTPSGRLADTWAKSYDDIPFARQYSYLNGELKEEFYKEGIYVGYRYFDSFGVEPLYPFGFGLSYTAFGLYCTGISADGTAVTVKAAVTNTGSTWSGKEVAQLYVSAPRGQLHKEYQSLAAFAKTDLLTPGASQIVELSFELGRLASYREEDNCYVLEAGEYVLRLGRHSRDTVSVGVLTLEREVIVSRHRGICPARDPLEELAAPARAPEELDPGLLRIVMDPGAFETTVYDYAPPAPCDEPRVNAFVDSLSLRDMAQIVVGIGMFGPTRFNLPGSVGNTTSKFWDKGLANTTLCDGPAGLRIQRHSTVDKKGRVKPVQMALSAFEMLPGFIKKLMTGDPGREPSLYQFTTAFPVTAALAQSWNTELLHRVGDAIHQEMKEYGCVYWLAPAINIHRNPLCGRNFEYYSEDPLLTGLLAAALTRGAQQEEGYYVTAKHFACNNQEDNRSFVSSNVSQRALREIYLRGFEYAVRDGGAKAIMTSYNRLNGVYTPNSHDLCTKVLRSEWGFGGVVMTDWYATNAGQADNALCLSAGNDLIMPGSGRAKRDILAGIRSGRITEDDLRRCCANVVKATMNSAIQKEYIG